jgi:hypothetical protein
MLPEATSNDLMYVSNGNGTVTVYSYPQGKMVGTLLGFDVPEGECVDAAGNVFVTVYDLGKIFEYAHGGTKPLAKLSGTEEPWSCSVDPTSGNLAVDTTAFGGPVSIYAHAKGSPKIYGIGIQAPWCGYDNKGNLFVSGTGSPPLGFLEELPRGSSGFVDVSVYGSGKAYPAGAVQWDGRYLAVGDGGEGGMDINRFAVTKGTATKKGEGTFIGSTTTVFWIYGTTIAALNDHANIGIWKYPAGGYPTKIVYHGVQYPTGITISPAKKESRAQIL